VPRQIRLEYPGAIYHVLNRGDRREAIFRDDGDCHDFIKTLAEACQKTGFEIHAFCLMKNHFHLVVETPEGNLVAGMRWLLSTYSNRFNRRHQLCGHVFSGRYKALVVDGGGSGYLRTVCDYTHLNPVRAGLLSAENRLLEYPWSSFGYYLREAKHRPKWLRVDRLLGEHGIGKDTASGRLEFERRMEGRRSGEGEAKQWQGMRRGWCLGTPEFKKGLLERMHGQLGPNHSASLRREASGERGEGIIAQELRRLGWKEGDLSLRPKTDADKVDMVARLRAETTMTLGQIAQRLKMGTRDTLSAKLQERKGTNE
jgi:REP element-mobilizing transposase RayT